ncbi:hypothetical protein ENHYDAX1_220242 [Enhydrobacter sp. AX1]|nr:hypothetical protein ENHYDAX1_220242 [Enhydrobacter sp. AX1]
MSELWHYHRKRQNQSAGEHILSHLPAADNPQKNREKISEKTPQKTTQKTAQKIKALH